MTHPTDITLRRGEIAEDVAVTIAGRYGATVTALTDATVIRIDGGQRERPGRGAARYAPPLSVILMGGPAGTGALATIRHRPRPTWKAWRADLRDAYLAALTPPHHDEVA